MQLSDIQRDTITIPAISEMASLGRDVHRLLGYSLLRDKTDKPQLPPLLSALAVLEIPVLHAEHVRKYQRELQIKETRKLFEEWAASTSTPQPDVPFTGLCWSKVVIGNYHEEVPAFALRKAAQIKETFPDACVMVEYLGDTPDPFLIAEVSACSWKYREAESYYVEAWAEPGFEAKR